MAAIDLTTLARVKTHLGIKDVDTASDALLTWLVTACSAWIIKQLGDRAIKSATCTDTLNGTGGTRVVLRQGPVTGVTSVTVDAEPIGARTTVGDTGYVHNNGIIDLVGYVFTEGIANVVIVYTAGYASVPEDMDQAVLMWVTEVFKSRDRQGLASRTVPSGESVTFKPDDIPIYIKMVIDSYKRILGVPQ